MFIKSTEYAAYGAYKYKGKKDKIAADQAAVDGMRKQLNLIKMKNYIYIVVFFFNPLFMCCFCDRSCIPLFSGMA